MRTTIDRRGRVVVPRVLRDGMRLEAGTVLEIAEEDGRLVIAPAPVAMRLQRRGEALAAVPGQRLAALTVDEVRDILEATHRQPPHTGRWNWLPTVRPPALAGHLPREGPARGEGPQPLRGT